MNWTELICCLLLNAVFTIVIVKGMTMKMIINIDDQMNKFMKDVINRLS